MNKLSVLQNATSADIQTDPFPHIILHNALPGELCDELIDSYPPLEVLRVDEYQNNLRWSYSAHKVKQNDLISPVWKDFIEYHVSYKFFNEMISLFYPAIYLSYPDRYPSIDSTQSMRVGVREIDDFSEMDILLDAQICGNTAVHTASSVKTAHIDYGNKLFSGLLYLRPDSDDSIGGDLNICRFKPHINTFEEKLKYFNGYYVDDEHIDVIKTIKYKKNTLVLFINTLDSLHSVTVRHPTSHIRIFLNLIGEVDPSLYEGRQVKNDQAENDQALAFIKKIKKFFLGAC